MHFDASDTLHWVECILSIQVIISSLEIIKIEDILKDEGLLSWRIHRLNHPKVALFIKKIRLDFLFRFQMTRIVIVIRILMAFMISIFVIINFSVLMPLLFIFFSTIFLTLRNPQSNDGSDQMASIVIYSCTLAECVTAGYGKEIAIYFIVAQSSLAYATSGFLKLTKKGWQNGDYVPEILKTSSFGNLRLLAYIEKKNLLPLFWGVVWLTGTV